MKAPVILELGTSFGYSGIWLAEAARATGGRLNTMELHVLLASTGLIASTGLGIWLGLKSGRNRGLSLALLLAGVAIPTVLLAF